MAYKAKQMHLQSRGSFGWSSFPRSQQVVYESDIKSATACIESYAAMMESVCRAFPHFDTSRRSYALIYHDK